jgi:6-phosphogluconate dehydrogenase
MAQRLKSRGHRVVAYDISSDARSSASAAAIEVADSLEELTRTLGSPRRVWVMLPAGEPTEEVLSALTLLLASGDLVIDGGNSDFRDSQRRAARLEAGGVRFSDVGVSGGIWGDTSGYGLTFGGTQENFADLRPLLDDLAAPGALARVGDVGCGHYSKMVHNAVEYAVMEAYAEGFELLAASDLELDVGSTIDVWQAGCSIRSWLLSQFAAALAASPGLDGMAGHVSDSGMGRWATEEALRLAVPIPAITSALFARFVSQQAESPAMKAIAAMRHQVGGHVAASAAMAGPR